MVSFGVGTKSRLILGSELALAINANIKCITQRLGRAKEITPIGRTDEILIKILCFTLRAELRDPRFLNGQESQITSGCRYVSPGKVRTIINSSAYQKDGHSRTELPVSSPKRCQHRTYRIVQTFLHPVPGVAQ